MRHPPENRNAAPMGSIIGSGANFRHGSSAKVTVPETYTFTGFSATEFASAQAANMAGLNAYLTMRELGRVGFSDLRRLFTESGALRDPSTWDDDIAAAVASVEVVTRQGAETDAEGNRTVEYVHKVKLWDKNSALDKIGRHLDLLVERHEHTGKNGAPLVSEISSTDIAKTLVTLLNSARQGA